MELIRHQRLERVRQGIKVVHPPRSAEYIGGGDREAREDDEPEAEDGAGHHGLV